MLAIVLYVMNMFYGIMILVLPSILGIRIIQKIKKNVDMRELIMCFLLLVLFSNFLIMIPIILLNGFDGNILTYINEHYMFSFKYELLSIFINCILPVLFIIIEKYIQVDVEVKDEKQKRKKSA